MAAALVIALRIALPLAILRWPLAGGLLAMAVDAFDVVLVEAFASLLGEPRAFGEHYPQLDKWLDLYYLTLEATVAWRWPEALLRRTLLALFAWRVVGVVAFEVTAMRELLVVFPNLFENLFLYVLVARRFAPRLLPRTWPQMGLLLLLLYVPKAVQEWLLHWEQLKPWQWLRDTFVVPILGW